MFLIFCEMFLICGLKIPINLGEHHYVSGSYLSPLSLSLSQNLGIFFDPPPKNRHFLAFIVNQVCLNILTRFLSKLNIFTIKMTRNTLSVSHHFFHIWYEFWHEKKTLKTHKKSLKCWVLDIDVFHCLFHKKIAKKFTLVCSKNTGNIL